MKLIKLIKSIHGKSAWAIYTFSGHRMDVYLSNNKPCSKNWGDLRVICWIKPTVAPTEENTDRIIFTNYDDFMAFKRNIDDYIASKIQQ